MAIQSVRRTYRASIRNYRQVSDGLDSLGFAASKLWNIGRWTVARIWDETGTIHAFDLQKYLKKHERYGDLHSQSSQRVLSELGEAFESWYEHRKQGNDVANPPGYRKHGDDHPRSTITFKKAGFKHDAKHGYIRLSKGQNLKSHRGDFVLCSYDTRPDVDLADECPVSHSFAVVSSTYPSLSRFVDSRQLHRSSRWCGDTLSCQRAGPVGGQTVGCGSEHRGVLVATA